MNEEGTRSTGLIGWTGADEPPLWSARPAGRMEHLEDRRWGGWTGTKPAGFFILGRQAASSKGGALPRTSPFGDEFGGRSPSDSMTEIRQTERMSPASISGTGDRRSVVALARLWVEAQSSLMVSPAVSEGSLFLALAGAGASALRASSPSINTTHGGRFLRMVSGSNKLIWSIGTRDELHSERASLNQGRGFEGIVKRLIPGVKRQLPHPSD